MNRNLGKAIATTSLVLLAAVALPATAQSDPHGHDQAAPAGRGSQGPGAPGMGMGGGMMGDQRMMMDMMQNCRQMMQDGAMGARGLPRLPEGNEKLELQMHADMMKAMGDILANYAARLPDKK